MKKQLFRYWLAMNASAIQSAAHAGKAWLATAGIHALNESIPALNLQQFGAVLLFAFGAEILNWLDKNPILPIT
jgi:hypothetical protein